MPVTLDFPPRLMAEAQAAHTLGVSVSKLRTMGIRRKRLDGKRVYDRFDLEAFADSLPYEDEGEENTCDGAFGQ